MADRKDNWIGLRVTGWAGRDGRWETRVTDSEIAFTVARNWIRAGCFEVLVKRADDDSLVRLFTTAPAGGRLEVVHAPALPQVPA